MKRILCWLTVIILVLTGCGQREGKSDAVSGANSKEAGSPVASSAFAPKHLDDFKELGFIYEAVSEGQESVGGGGSGVAALGNLVSDNTTIAFGEYRFSYQVKLSDSNPAGSYWFTYSDPALYDNSSYERTDVGYGIRLPMSQMKEMYEIAKRIHDAPENPFLDCLPEEVATAAAESRVYVGVSRGGRLWDLSFISLDNGHARVTYGDGSQDIIPETFYIQADKALYLGGMYLGENAGSPDSAVGLNGIKDNIKKEGNFFDPETLEWTFSEEVISPMIDLIKMIGS